VLIASDAFVQAAEEQSRKLGQPADPFPGHADFLGIAKTQLHEPTPRQARR